MEARSAGGRRARQRLPAAALAALAACLPLCSEASDVVTFGVIGAPPQPRAAVASAGLVFRGCLLWLAHCVAAHAFADPLTPACAGNWGGAGVAPYTTLGQLQAAAGFEAIAADTDMSFVISTGGNFLPVGLPGASSLPLPRVVCPPGRGCRDVCAPADANPAPSPALARRQLARRTATRRRLGSRPLLRTCTPVLRWRTRPGT